MGKDKQKGQIFSHLACAKAVSIKGTMNVHVMKLLLRAILLCRWFTHFYGWSVLWNCFILGYIISIYMDHVPLMLQWISSILTIVIGHDTGAVINKQNWRFSTCQSEIILALVMQTFQVTRRFLECLYISVFTNSQMHLLHYIVGYFFYTWTGPTILSQFATCM